MEQRPLRLGDIVDDYCPRERRVTNHAIVALVDDAIRQTRCTTCDTEHVFKGGRAPRRRVKEAEAEAAVVPEPAVIAPAAVDAPVPYAAVSAAVAAADEPLAASAAGQSSGGVNAFAELDTPEAVDERPQEDGWAWPANRTLIRATLPRIEGEQPPPRPIPEFTIYQRQNTRNAGGFRRSGWRGGPEPNGNRAGGNGNGHGHGRPGQGNGFGGQNQGQGGRRRHGKRRPR